MIKIRDVEAEPSNYWEVSDTEGVLPKTIFTYDKNDPIKYDRVYVLKLIVDKYKVLGYDMRWEKEGSILILEKK